MYWVTVVAPHAKRKEHKILDEVKCATYRKLIDILPDLDQELVKGAVAGERFSELFFAFCKDEALAAYVKTFI